MKLIVVGMDNTGKTTLCENLSKVLKAAHVISGGPNRSREEMLQEIVSNMEKKGNIIFERFPIFEELVYGKVLRGKSKFAFDDIDRVKKYKPIIIYCRPSDETIYNFGDRKQMKGVIENKDRLLKAWDELIYDSLSGFRVIQYDWTKDKLGDLFSGEDQK